MRAVADRQANESGAVEVYPAKVDVVGVLVRIDAARAEPDLLTPGVDPVNAADDPLTPGNLVLQLARTRIEAIEVVNNQLPPLQTVAIDIDWQAVQDALEKSKP